MQLFKTTCKNFKIKLSNHFRDVTKMVKLGSGASREILDTILTIKRIWNK